MKKYIIAIAIALTLTACGSSKPDIDEDVTQLNQLQTPVAVAIVLKEPLIILGIALFVGRIQFGSRKRKHTHTHYHAGAVKEVAKEVKP